MQQVKVLFVCMGNICRSPTAHGVFRDLVQKSGLDDKIIIDSAGTHAYHVGKSPDSRSQQVAKQRGMDMSDLRARIVTDADFYEFDLILAMDGANYQDLLTMATPDTEHKVKLFLDFAENSSEQEVPDPYYGGAKGFDRVFDMVEDASLGLLRHIVQ